MKGSIDSGHGASLACMALALYTGRKARLTHPVGNARGLPGSRPHPRRGSGTMRSMTNSTAARSVP